MTGVNNDPSVGGTNPTLSQPGSIDVTGHKTDNAATAKNDYALGLSPSDSLAAWLGKVSGSGPDAIKTQNSPAGQPSLLPPDISFESFTDQTIGMQQANSSAYQSLIAQLPQSLQTAILVESSKDPDDQNPSVAALISFLTNITPIVAAEKTIQAVGTQDDEGSSASAQGGGATQDTAKETKKSSEKLVSNKGGTSGTAGTGSATGVSASGAATGVAAASPSAATANANMKSVISNGIITPLNTVQAYLKSALSTSPTGSEGTQSMVDFLGTIKSVLSAAMESLQKMGTDDSKNDQILMSAQRDMQQAVLATTMKQIQDAQAAAEKQAHMSLIMKIVMPIITVVLAVAAVAVTVATAGAAAPEAAIGASIAIGAISTALSVADSCTGFVSQPMQAGFASLQKALPGNQVEKIFAEIVILLAFVAVSVLVTKGAGAGAASKVGLQAGETATEAAVEGSATMLAKSAAREVVSSAVESMAISYTIQAVTTSNVIVDLVSVMMNALLEKLGKNADSQTTQWVAQVAQAIIILVVVLSVIGSKGKSAGGLSKAMSTGMQKMMNVVASTAKALQYMGEAGQAGAGIYSGVTQLQIANILKDQAAQENAMAQLNTFTKALGGDISNLQEAMQDTFKNVNNMNDLFNQIIATMSNEINSLTFT